MTLVAKNYIQTADLFESVDRDTIANVAFGPELVNDDRYHHAQNHDDLVRLIMEINANGQICHLRVKGQIEFSLDLKSPPLAGISLETEGNGSVNLSNLNTKGINFHCRNPEANLSRCRVGRVSFNSDASSKIYIENSKIGVLDLRNTSEKCSLRLFRCDILQLQIKSDLRIYSIHMMKCNLESRNVIIPSSEYWRNLPRVDRQAFSYLRNWAERNSDGFTAHVARGYELAAETHEERGFTKLMLHLWGFFGRHGLSPLRPLIWAALLWVGMATALFVTGTDLGQTVQGASASGWLEAMSGQGEKAQIYRSLILAFNSAINPFAVFGTRNLIVPDSLAVAVLMPFHGLLSLGLILLSGFSLRRRLKWV